jgi:hypothetical protein
VIRAVVDIPSKEEMFPNLEPLPFESFQSQTERGTASIGLRLAAFTPPFACDVGRSETSLIFFASAENFIQRFLARLGMTKPLQTMFA